MMTNPMCATKTPRPVVLVGERPLHAAELAFAYGPAVAAEETLDPRADVLFGARGDDRRVERHVLDLDRAQGREARGDDALERADREGREDEPDDPDVRGVVVDVVEVQAQDEPGERGRIGVEIETGVLSLIDDHADQRQQTPRGEQRDREQDVREERECVAHEAAHIRAERRG
jgi:hypothetical protein